MILNFVSIFIKFYALILIMSSLNLKKFEMNKIGKGSVVVMIGKRNTGKSFLTKDLLYYKRDVR